MAEFVMDGDGDCWTMPDNEDVLDVLVESGVSVAVVFDDTAATWVDGTPAGSMPTGRTIDVP